MLAIIAHHSIVNSGVIEKVDMSALGLCGNFTLLWGMWGKTAINSFVIISGYFLCKGRLTWQRYVKLLVEVYFYSFLFYFVFSLTGYEGFSVKRLLMIPLYPLKGVNSGFTASFLAFYVFVPVYNVVLKAFNRKQQQLLIFGLLLFFTFASTFLLASTMNEPLWYATIYLIGGHVRLYPYRLTESLKYSSILLALGIVVAVISVWVIGNCYNMFGSNPEGPGFHLCYYFVSDSNKLLSLWVGVCSFLFFKNLPNFYSKALNFIAAGTFGVLLIHANSDTMRHWLWKDFLDIPGNYEAADLWNFVMLELLVPISIFVICALLDAIRRWAVEKPMMRYLNKFK